MKDRAYGAGSRQGNGEDSVESHCSTAYFFLNSDYNLNCTAKIRNLDRRFSSFILKFLNGFLNREQP
jgi:hypothetical protein